MAHNDISEYPRVYAGTISTSADIGTDGVGLRVSYITLSNNTGATVSVVISGHGGTALPDGNLTVEIQDESVITIPWGYSPDGLRLASAAAVLYAVGVNEQGADR